jgi:hypothetical protein
VHPQDALEKALYDFDLTSPDGIDRFLELLPILDEAIVKDVYKEIFTGYPIDALPIRVGKIELYGFLKDYLEASDPDRGASSPVAAVVEQQEQAEQPAVDEAGPEEV